MAELRAATWPCHQRLERRLDVKARFSDAQLYRGHLQRMWGFCAPLEQQLPHGVLDGVLQDFEVRRKLPLLTLDLAAVGLVPSAISALPVCRDVPVCADAAAALGSVYVFEGATLGGRTLLPLVEKHLGYTAQRGASFLASYGSDVKPMWSRFGAAAEEWCGSAVRRAAAVAAAVATFEALEQWLCGVTS